MKNAQLLLYRILSLLITLIVAATISAQTPKVSAGKIEVLNKFQSKYIQPRDIYIWLPEGYTPTMKCPVVYMHDGQMLFDSTITWNHQEWGIDETMTRLINAGTIPPIIVVGIPSNGAYRHTEYFPEKPFLTLPESFQKLLVDTIQTTAHRPIIGTKPISNNYLSFIVKELKPYIDKHFATQKDRAHTFIAGSSMGGLISMYAICEYPKVFGGAACLSTHWPGIFTNKNNPIPSVFFNYMQHHLPKPSTHRLYFDYGSETLDSLYKPYQEAANVIIAKRGYTAANWQTVFYFGDSHSEASWRKRMDVPLVFLLGIRHKGISY